MVGLRRLDFPHQILGLNGYLDKSNKSSAAHFHSTRKRSDCFARFRSAPNTGAHYQLQLIPCTCYKQSAQLKMFFFFFFLFLDYFMADPPMLCELFFVLLLLLFDLDRLRQSQWIVVEVLWPNEVIIVSNSVLLLPPPLPAVTNLHII